MIRDNLFAYENPNRKTAIVASLAILIGATIGVFVHLIDNFILVGLVLGLILVLLTIREPEVGLQVFLLITYIRLSDVAIEYYNAPSIARGMVALLVVAVGLRWAIYRKLPVGWLKATVLILAYGVVIFGSLFYAANWEQAQLAASDYWKDGLIAILLVILIQNKGAFRRAIWTLIFAGIFMGSLSVHQYITGNFSSIYGGFAESPLLNIVSGTEGHRVGGPLGDPNFYAQILIVILPLAISRTFYETKMPLRILAGFASLVIGMSIVFTFSRGGLIALIICLVALIVYQPPRFRAIFIIIGVLWVVLLLLPPTYKSRMGTLTNLNESPAAENSFRGRVSEMLSAWYMFRDNPILGVGANNYPIYYQDYSRQIGLDPRAENREPHNLYLEVAAETGLVGLIVFGVILYTVFSTIHNARQRLMQTGDVDLRRIVESFSAGAIGYLAAALFIHGAYPRYLWVLVGLALSLTQIAGKEKQVPVVKHLVEE